MTAKTDVRLQREYELLVEHLPLGVLSVAPDGSILQANPAARRMLDWTSIGAARETNLLKASPSLRSGIDRDVQQCLESGETVISERPYISKRDRSVYLRLHLIPIQDHRERITSVQVLMEDITELKLTERALREAQGRFEDQDSELSKLSHAIEYSANVVMITQVFAG